MNQQQEEKDEPEITENFSNIGCSVNMAENIAKTSADLKELFNSALAIIPSYASLCGYGTAIVDSTREKWGQLLEEVALTEAESEELNEQQREPKQEQEKLVNKPS